MSESNETKNNHSFESAITRLEEIVRALEVGQAPLDTSLALFEEGISLVKLCNRRLDEAEQKIKILQGADDGSMIEADFGGTRA
ncbi:MAG: exodeoxyribonuclease VII small subunit [Clostridia bacterium]|nr:exodeoxyribonuclease VII small subunit [Clostridia bacterium]